MIIVKSQNGGRIKECKEIFISTMSDNTGMKEVHRILDEEEVMLGTYETLEQAKEVMNMIEKRIRVLYASKMASILATCDVDDVDSEHPDVMEEAIFTMPKE